MKTTIKTFVVALISLVAVNVNAADGLVLKVNNDQNLMVQIETIENGARLTLKNKSGEILFKNVFFEEESFTKTLSFKDLADGEYHLSLDKKFSISTWVIRKSGDQLDIDKNAYALVFKPIFKKDDKLVYFYVANPTEEKTYLEIYDKSGVLVGTSKSDKLVVKKTLDFSTMPNGEYSVIVKMGNKKFTERIFI
ncbi:DUF3244 domain-containing protein [Gillisia sp. CAL575]|uniref:DUF3244 domain-containing protein n=1 Tax=Gillisia sp. CAL575 TaxID=985255 RepID=UPI0003A75206|nr:hypothetical protein [Gillisia sp. CAL575]